VIQIFGQPVDLVLDGSTQRQTFHAGGRERARPRFAPRGAVDVEADLGDYEDAAKPTRIDGRARGLHPSSACRVRIPLSRFSWCAPGHLPESHGGRFLRLELGADAERVGSGVRGNGRVGGSAATEPSIKIGSDNGVDLTSHRSRRLTPALVVNADLVLVMERAHLAAVHTLGGDPKKVHLLSEYPPPVEPSWPVSDPFGASVEAYE
jgi:protein-tyrosine phosphatase